MWLFGSIGRSKKASSYQPVQRQVSITTTQEGPTDNDRYTALINSPSFTSSSAIPEDDVTIGGSPDRFNVSILSGHREPLDACTWSSVTSPGFTSRVVSQANSSPLKEFNNGSNSSLNRSVFSGSPNRHLKLGQLPYSPWKQKQNHSSPLQFPSNTVNRRNRGRYIDNGTTYIRIAPVDPDKALMSPLQPGTPVNNLPNLSSDSFSRSPPNGGLGGIPQSVLSAKFQRLWPSTNPIDRSMRMAPSPNSPSPGILEALQNRKRSRVTDAFVDKTTTPMRSSVMSSDETPNKNSKRVKFLTDDRNNRSLSMVPLHNMHGPDDESMTSESILEQMNQTEKRFLPDDDAPSRSLQKKKSPRGVSMQSSPFKKKKSPNSISVVDKEDPKDKNGRFCTCTECYEEAAGVSSFIEHNTSPPRNDRSFSQVGSGRKSVTFNLSHSDVPTSPSKAMISKATETDILAREVVIMKSAATSGGVINMEMYKADKKKSAERLRKILCLDDHVEKVTLPAPESLRETASSFSFGSNPLPPNNFGFATAPVASSTSVDVMDGNKKDGDSPAAVLTQANTTSGSVLLDAATAVKPLEFGSSKESVTTSSSEQPQTSVPSFGISASSETVSTQASILSTSTTPSLPSIFGTNPPSISGFGDISSVIEKKDSAPTTTTTAPSGGFSFGSPIVTPVSQPAASASTGLNTSQPPGVGTSIFGNNTTQPTSQPTPLFGSGNNNTSVTSTFGQSTTQPPNVLNSDTPTVPSIFGQNQNSTPAVSTIGSTSGGNIFGQSLSSSTPVTFGQTTNNQSSANSLTNSATVTFGQSSNTESTGNTPVTFGQSSNTESTGNTPATFGQSSITQSTGSGSTAVTFGQSSNTQSTGTTPVTFGQTTTNQPTANSMFKPNLNQNPGFGSPAQNNNTFGSFGQQPNANASFGSNTGSFNFGSNETASTQASILPTSTTPSLPSIFGTNPPTSISSFAGVSSVTEKKDLAPTTTTTAPTGGFSFGSPIVTPVSQPAASASTGLNTSQPPGVGTSIFGNNMTQPTSQPTPLFGSGNNNTSVTSTFGQPTTQPSNVLNSNTPTVPSIFGQNQNSTAAVPTFGSTSGGNIFGQSLSSSTPVTFGQTTNNQSSANSLTGSATVTFGQSSNTQSTGNTPVTFGQTSTNQPTANSMFKPNLNQNPGFGSPAQNNNTFGSFGQQPNANTSFGSNPGSFNFGSIPSNTTPAPTNLFGGSASTTTNPPPAFGSTSSGFNPPPAFGSSTSGANVPTFGSPNVSNPSAFGSSNTGQNPPTFGSSTTTSNPPMFGSTNPPAFGSGGTNVNPPPFGSSVPTSNPPAFGSSVATSNPPAFGSSVPTSNPPAFGSTTVQPGFGSPSGTFNFQGQAAQPQGGGFAFGQSNPNTNNNNANTSSAPGLFQFGQQQPQSPQGGFNFAAQANTNFTAGMQGQQPGPMFSLGSTTATPARRREARPRRYR